MFYNDLAKGTLNRRTERIPQMVKYQKQGLQVYFIWDRLIVKDKDGRLIRPRLRPGDNGEVDFLVKTTKMARLLSKKAILNNVLKVFDYQSWTPTDSGLFFISHNIIFLFNVTGNVNLY